MSRAIATTIFSASIHCDHKSVDQPIAPLIRNLKRRGMLEDPLVLTGELGRTVDNKLTHYHAGRDNQLSQIGDELISELIA